MTTFFKNQTSDLVSTVVHQSSGGSDIVKVTGVADGATVQMLVDFKDDDYAPLLAGLITSPDAKMLTTKAGVRIKCEISGAGAGTDLTVQML